MSKTVWSLVACALWLAGCDPSIGTDECIASGCAKPKGFQPTVLNVTFQRVDTDEAADLPIKWRIPRPCTGPCMPPTPITLLRAEGDAVWTAPRDGALLALDRVDATGTVSRTAIPTPGTDIAGLLSSNTSTDLQGRAVVHLQWGGPETARVDEVAVVQQPGLVAAVTLRQSATLSSPLGTIATPAGYLLFGGDQGDQGGHVVRLVTLNGETAWQQTQFPVFARSVGTSAAFTDHSFVLGASDGDPKDIHYGLLSLDPGGLVTEFDVTSDSRWTSATLLQLSVGAYAVAAGSHLHAESSVGSGTGNIDVVVVGADQKLTGYRIMRSCYQLLSVLGFTSDAAGNLYVSSLAGTEKAPRGLLCRLSSSAPPRCFQAEPQLLLGQIAATNAGVIFAAAGDEILRIELPP